jgi:hypothetical protein
MSAVAFHSSLWQEVIVLEHGSVDKFPVAWTLNVADTEIHKTKSNFYTDIFTSDTKNTILLRLNFICVVYLMM